MDVKKLSTWLLDGVEVPEGTAGAVKYETDAIAPETGLYAGGMTKGSADYRTALFVDGGKIAENQSVTAAVVGGSYDSAKLEGGVIKSENKYFNGVMINDTDYSIKGLTMVAQGSGGNDFKGFGAGIACYGKSNVVVDGYAFDGAGAIRHGVFAGGTKPEDKLTVTVKNSFVKSNGSKYENAAEGMSGCPWMLGISNDGHARATMIDGYADVTYESDILLSDGWGVLSIDDTGDTVKWGEYSIDLKVKNSVIDVTTEGTDDPSCYATYSIGGCFNKFYGCTVGNAADSHAYKALKAGLKDTAVNYDYNTKKYGMTYAAVVANEHASAGWYDGCNVTTKYGVMYHKTANVRWAPGTESEFAPCGVTEVKNSTFNTYGAAFLVKACVPVIEVENSKFNSEKGVIVQLMVCDDPGMGNPAYAESVDTSAPVEADPKYDPYDYNLRNQTFFRKFNVNGFVGDVQASFKDCKGETALKGSFFNSISVETEGEGMKWWGQNLILSFDNCEIEGACSSSTALHDEYSFFTAKADNEYGAIAINADGYEIKGNWEKPKSKMPGPMPDMGDMPGGPGGPGVDMPGGPGGPEMGGGPGGPGGMPDMGGMMPMMMAEPAWAFTPELDENGNVIVIGTEKLTADQGHIISTDATLLGNLSNTASPTVNNGVWVALKNGSVWIPVGDSFISRLEVEAGCEIKGTVLMDGAEVAVEPGKVYTGKILVKG